MLLIGLTGSLATGKSTVSALLRSPPHNLPIIDADVLARQVVEPGTYGYRRVVSTFGPTTPDLLLPPEKNEDDNTNNATTTTPTTPSRTGRPINRSALGRRVFGSTPSRTRDRKLLNGIIHPLVRLAILRSLLYYHIRGHWAVVLDIPLLYESGLDVFCGTVVMVSVGDPRTQMRRLRERDKGLSAREAEERVGSQMGVEEKVGRTEVRGEKGGRGLVVLNDGTRGELEGEVRRVMGRIEEEGGRRWKWRRVWLWGNPLAVVIVGLWEIWLSWRARRRYAAMKRADGKME